MALFSLLLILSLGSELSFVGPDCWILDRRRITRHTMEKLASRGHEHTRHKHLHANRITMTNKVTIATRKAMTSIAGHHWFYDPQQDQGLHVLLWRHYCVGLQKTEQPPQGHHDTPTHKDYCVPHGRQKL
ncbi:hypothetical protein ACROYT_G034587 [Oculina patagonica]